MAKSSSKTNIDSIYGRVVVEKTLCSSVEVQECMEMLRDLAKQGNHKTLVELLQSRGYITASQAKRIKPNVEASRPSHQIPGFQMIDKLGAGAMAVVFRAKQLSLDRMVAIKVLPKRLSENPEYVERFYKEGRAAAKLNHNNIVQAIDVGEANGTHYFVMEYVKGKTVYDDLSQGGAYTETEALDIAIQIADALEHAHEKGLMHRDVKPKNIIITESAVAKLADMGLAREATDQAAAKMEEGRAYGTPYYISPEQIRGEVDIDYRVDIYSLGATLYHMVTGRVPFEASTPSAVMHKHLKEALIPPDHINGALSVGISEVIEVMMAKRREDRYRGCTVLLEDLKAVRAGDPPLQAHQKFDATVLADLGKGHSHEEDFLEDILQEQAGQIGWKMSSIILGGLLLVAVLVIIMMSMK